MIVLNPNENVLELEKVGDPSADTWDEPAEKRERKEECEEKKKKDGYEKYRNLQKERETKRIPIRVSEGRWREGRAGREGGSESERDGG